MAEYDITEAGGRLTIIADEAMMRLKKAERVFAEEKTKKLEQKF